MKQSPLNNFVLILTKGLGDNTVNTQMDNKKKKKKSADPPQQYKM